MTKENKSHLNNFTNTRPLKVRVSPLVEVTALDSFMRRAKKESRAIGTLLGYISEGNILEVTDCYPVVHADSIERGVLLDQSFHLKMFGLRHSVSPREQVVGWFSVQNSADKGGSTGQKAGYNVSAQGGAAFSELNENTVTVHNYYRSKESGFKQAPQYGFTSPVFLQVDAGMGREDGIKLKCFSSEFVPGSDQNLISFYEVPVLKSMGAEKKIMSLIAGIHLDSFEENGYRLQNECEAVDVENLHPYHRDLSELKDLFQKAKSYVDDNVLSGKVEGNNLIGRQLLKEIRGIERQMHLEDEGSQTVKDALMVRYLSTLCRTQMQLGEKIGRELANSKTEE